MRAIILALALVFAVGNAPSALDTELQTLIDSGQTAEALTLAQASAERGEAEGHDWLGWFHENGEGVAVSFTIAEFHYRIAAGEGDNHAAWRLGVLIDGGQIGGKLEEAVALFQTAAKRDYIKAIVSLAVMQATGRGTPKDFGAAMGNYMRAAQLGDSHGVRGVGVMLLLGEGVAADADEAAAWFLVSAAMGNEEAEANLKLVLRDIPKADVPAIGRRALAIAEQLGVEVPIFVEEPEPALPAQS